MQQDFKEREFVLLLSHDSRVRHYHSRLKQQVVEFMVQLEINVKGEWRPVVRYDTAHGFAHREFFHSDGKVEKVPLSNCEDSEATPTHRIPSCQSKVRVSFEPIVNRTRREFR